MAAEAATMNGNSRRSESPINTRGMIVDLLQLAELQWELLLIDLRETRVRGGAAAVGLAIGLTTMVAGLIIGLMAAAEFLRFTFQLRNDLALLLVFIPTMAIAAFMTIWNAQKAAAAAEPLKRSSEELAENVRWIRSLLSNEHKH